MEETKVIEQEHNHVEYTEEGEVVMVKLEEPVEPEKHKQVVRERCIFIKKDGKQCRQSGKPTQSGGPIINQYCSYHIPTLLHSDVNQ
tara:strand:- start:148 stop:408 length:261 start_codon:yes stop_codon:yes gene_type:complete